MSNICPICKKDDQLIKASAIVQGGTHNISGQVPVSRTYQDSNGLQERTTYENYHATQQSSLAHKLMPPEKPKLPSKPASFWLFFYGAWTIGVIAQSIVVIPETGALNAIFAFVVLESPAVFLFFRHQKSLREFPSRLASANDETKKWQNAINRWNQLYYCYRDDCVFVIGDTRSSDSSKIREYLYQS